MWTRLARLSLPWRCLIKWAALVVVVILALYPCPYLLIKQVAHFTDFDSLVDTKLPALAQINQEIDAQLKPGHTREEEFKSVERYVYQQIKYQYDWFNWGNLDYWPTAAEVWAKKREDCDGRAVLATSILRSRGFKSARMVANLNHVWVTVDNAELMGPQADKNIRKVGDKTVVTFPTLRTWLGMLAHINKFPAIRSLFILVGALLIAYHPCRSLAGFLGAGVAGMAGYALLLDWAQRYGSRDDSGAMTTLIGGLLLLAGALAGALAAERVAGMRRRKAVAGAGVAAVIQETKPA